ncbi:DUF6894 family protein [Methylobacterium amylolyticum]|uniref:DUF6894 family protein n=1 Tax=Methylobacterium sp. NEAU 140 TaxID=3064945 RepID=UPI00351F9ECB
MPTRLYRFHCTDGVDLIVDDRGKRLPNPSLVRAHADRLARELMAVGGGRLDWSGWCVEVYDAVGRRFMSRAFADAVRPADRGVPDRDADACRHGTGKAAGARRFGLGAHAARSARCGGSRAGRAVDAPTR